MADDGSQFPRIPPRLQDWQELNRRVAALSGDVLSRLEDLERRANSFSAPYNCSEKDTAANAGEAAWRTSGLVVQVFNEDSAGNNWFTVFQSMIDTIAGGELHADGTTWEITSVTQVGGTGGRHEFGITPAQAAPSVANHVVTWVWP